jgi:hypothetical protein
MKKYILPTVALVVVIGALVAYLLLRQGNQVYYTVPELRQVAHTAISELTIQVGTDTEITLAEDEEEDIWRIQPEGWPADPTGVDRLTRAMASLTLTDLVSVSERYDRYELGEDAILVTAGSGDATIRNVRIGKRAPSYDHTYVVVEGDSNVYMAEGNLRQLFDTEKNRLRDKAVLSFDPESVTELTAQLQDEVITIRKAASAPAPEGEEAEQTWVDDSGTEWDSEEMDDLLTNLSTLKCMNYRDEDTPPGPPVLFLTVQAEEEHTLTIYEGGQGGYPGQSSDNDYWFFLSTYQGKTITETFLEDEEEEG